MNNSYDTIYNVTPEAQRKVLTNIRKRQERKKRKKEVESSVPSSDIDKEETVAQKSKISYESAYEDVVYGSESELNSDKNDDLSGLSEDENDRKKGRRKYKQGRVWIKEGGDQDDEVMDFLDRKVIGRVFGTFKQWIKKKKPIHIYVFIHSYWY